VLAPIDFDMIVKSVCNSKIIMDKMILMKLVITTIDVINTHIHKHTVDSYSSIYCCFV